MKEMISIIHTDQTSKTETQYTFDSGATWQQHMQAMINFLRGLGYHIPEEEDRV